VFKALALLLLLPVDAAPKEPVEPWITVTAIMLFVGHNADRAFSAHWTGVETAPLVMPSKLSNWTCKRSGRDRGDQLTSYIECSASAATIVIDATCKKDEEDADIGSAILLNKARDYGGRIVITCVTARDPRSRSGAKP